MAGKPQPRGLSAVFASLAIRPFRWVWLAALSGNSGRFAVILVAGWEAYRLGGHSSLWPSLVMMLLLVPSMVFGLVAGSFADRLNRARMAATGQLVSAFSCAVAAILTITGGLDLERLLALTALVGIGNSVQGPAWQAMIPDLVGPERLLNASMMTRIAQQGAELTGPALGTVVLAEYGPGPAFFCCAGFYVAALAMLMRIRHSVLTPVQLVKRPGLLAPVADGLRYVTTAAPIGTLLVWVGLHCSLTMASIGILPAVATANLHGDAGAYGLLLTSFGLGSVLGPLAMMWLGRRVQVVPLLIVSGIASGLPLITLGLVQRMGVDLVSSGLAGAGQAVFMAGIYSANQGVAIDAMRGRVASVQLSLTTGAMGITSIGWGVLAGMLAPGIVLAIPGFAFLIACIPFSLRHRRISAPLRRAMSSPAAAPRFPVATPEPAFRSAPDRRQA